MPDRFRGGLRLKGGRPAASSSEATLVPVPVRNPPSGILHPKITPIMGSSGVKYGTPKMKGDKNEHQRERTYFEAFTYFPSNDEGCARVDEETTCQGSCDRYGPHSPLLRPSRLDLLQPRRRVSEFPCRRVIGFSNCIVGQTGWTDHPAGAPEVVAQPARLGATLSKIDPPVPVYPVRARRVQERGSGSP